MQESMWGPAPAVNPLQGRGLSAVTASTTSVGTFTHPAQQLQANNNNTTMAGTAPGYESEDSKNKKKRKNKMQKLDASILGFTVQAAPDRVNIGEIDTGTS